MASQKVKEESQNTSGTPNIFNDFNSNIDKEQNYSNALNLLHLRSYYLNYLSNLQGLLYLNSLPNEQKKHMINLLQMASHSPCSPNSTIINNYYLNGNFKFQPVLSPPANQYSNSSKINKTCKNFSSFNSKVSSGDPSENNERISKEILNISQPPFRKTSNAKLEDEISKFY
jgi:hypothetical protein